MRYLRWLAVTPLLAVSVTGCIKRSSPAASAKADPATREALGLGADYIADPMPSADLASKLNHSMQERRKKGWAIGAQVFKMVAVPQLNQELPVWLTWYEMGEISGLFDRAWTSLSDADKATLQAGSGLSQPQINAVMLAAASATSDAPGAKLGPVLAQINTAEKAKRADVGTLERLSARRTGVPLANLAFTRHLLANANALAKCTFDTPADLDLQDKASFVACMQEFPRDAVMVKSAWEKVEDGIERFDLGPDAWRQAFASSLSVYLPGNQRAATPAADQIFRLRTSDGQEWALRAIHIATKETRNWIWTSFSWSETPDTDLGSDRPAMPAPWNHYKMTVVTDFIEQDPTPWIGANGQEIATLGPVKK